MIVVWTAMEIVGMSLPHVRRNPLITACPGLNQIGLNYSVELINLPSSVLSKM